MTPEQKQLNLLGLATRARSLVTGDELVEKSIKGKRVQVVICASDVSDATRERYIGLCERANVPLNLTFTREEISLAIGKTRSICAFDNPGMAKKFLSYVTGEKQHEINN